ncbi:MAG: type II toxin-antitoxin system VapC family toxin [Cyanobacteria bacterium K_DeepCast_150m_m2_101]|nr:type II toxin-antitoxin system VapC family toxin [Cyanobacteria bacterium K_DeepCast_150m_m2_101]
MAGVNVLLDTNVLSEPMRERPDAVVIAELEQGGHSLHTASLVIHELSYGIQRLADGRRKERFRSYLQNLLSSGLSVLPYDSAAALWHGEQRARLEARGLRPAFADGQIAAIAATQGLVLLTRNISDFAAFDGLHLLNWVSSP